MQNHARSYNLVVPYRTLQDQKDPNRCIQNTSAYKPIKDNAGSYWSTQDFSNLNGVKFLLNCLSVKKSFKNSIKMTFEIKTTSKMMMTQI